MSGRFQLTAGTLFARAYAPPWRAIEELELVLDGVRVFYRRVPGEGTPVVYCHGNPTHGEDWVPFMEWGGPSIAIDMPGWGRSDRPDAEAARRSPGF